MLRYISRIWKVGVFVLAVNSWGYGQFSAPQVVDSTAVGVADVAIADLDANGLADIVICQFPLAHRKIAVYWQQSPGQFSAPQVISAQINYPLKLALADVDNNGWTDIGFSSMMNSEIVWFPNTGGTIGAPLSIDTTIDRPRTFYFNDVEGDGDMDILAAGDIELALLRQTGPGSFSKELIQQVTEYYALHLKDVNGDTFVDLLVGSAQGLKIFLGDGSGGFTENNTILPNELIFLVYSDDLDGDQDNDVITLDSFSHELFWYRNDGDANFTFAQLLSSQAFNCKSVATADNDLDGDIDIFAAFDQHHIYVRFENQGAGIFGP